MRQSDEEKAIQLLERCEDEVEFRNRDGAIALIVEATRLAREEMRERAAMVCEKRAAVLRHAQRADSATQELDDSAAEIRELAAGVA